MTQAIDIIGLIYTGGELDAEGIVISPLVQIPGWHVNAIPEIPELAEYRIYPSQKRRVFSGMVDETVCYRFPDESTGMALLSPYLSPGSYQ